jgi:hypothetical protein
LVTLFFWGSHVEVDWFKKTKKPKKKKNFSVIFKKDPVSQLGNQKKSPFFF